MPRGRKEPFFLATCMQNRERTKIENVVTLASLTDSTHRRATSHDRTSPGQIPNRRRREARDGARQAPGPRSFSRGAAGRDGKGREAGPRRIMRRLRDKAIKARHVSTQGVHMAVLGSSPEIAWLSVASSVTHRPLICTLSHTILQIAHTSASSRQPRRAVACGPYGWAIRTRSHFHHLRLCVRSARI